MTALEALEASAPPSPSFIAAAVRYADACLADEPAKVRRLLRRRVELTRGMDRAVHAVREIIRGKCGRGRNERNG